jgi:hypothetical protein
LKMIDPLPSPLAAISLVDLTQIYRQHRQMREALCVLSETIGEAGCRPESAAAMQAIIRRALGE